MYERDGKSAVGPCRASHRDSAVIGARRAGIVTLGRLRSTPGSPTSGYAAAQPRGAEPWQLGTAWAYNRALAAARGRSAARTAPYQRRTQTNAVADQQRPKRLVLGNAWPETPRRFREKMPLSLFGRSSPRRKSRKQHEDEPNTAKSDEPLRKSWSRSLSRTSSRLTRSLSPCR